MGINFQSEAQKNGDNNRLAPKIGTNSKTHNLKAVQSRSMRWIFVFKLDVKKQPEDILKILNQHNPGDAYQCKKMKTQKDHSYSSFRLGVPVEKNYECRSLARGYSNKPFFAPTAPTTSPSENSTRKKTFNKHILSILHAKKTVDCFCVNEHWLSYEEHSTVSIEGLKTLFLYFVEAIKFTVSQSDK